MFLDFIQKINIQKPLFKKKNFKVCDLAVPSNYPQSQTHACIGTFINENNKTVYFVVTTPYPNIKYSKPLYFLYIVLKKIFKISIINEIVAEDYENPMLYYSYDLIEFFPYQFNPIVGKPTDLFGYGSYCSDPDLLVYGGELFILYRESVRIRKYPPYSIPHLFLIQLSYKNNKLKIINRYKFPDLDKNPVSPCLINFNNRFYCFYLVTNSYITGEPCEKLIVCIDDELRGLYKEKREIFLVKGDFEPWHLSIFSYKGKLYSIICAVYKNYKGRCYQLFGEFNDEVTELHIYQRPLTTLNSYRGSAMVSDDGEFILFSTTVREKFKDGISIDGREVIMGSMNFNELLMRLNEK